MATFSSFPCVYWSYLSDDGNYRPYPPDISACIEQSFASNPLLTYPIYGGRYLIDFSSMTQKRASTGNQRSIQRISINLPSSPIMAYWEWEESPGKFVLYGIQATVDIELACMKGQGSVDLSTTPTCIPYAIDMVAMQQTRHSYGTKRRIKRMNLMQPLHDYLKDYKRLAITGTSPSYGSGTFATPASPPVYGSGSFTSPATTMVSAGKSSPSKKKTKKRGKKSSVAVTACTSSLTPIPSPAVATSGRKTKQKLSDSNDKEDLLEKYVKRVSAINFGENGPCPICMSDLTEFSGFEEDVGLPVPKPSSLPSSSSSTPPSPDLCKLKKCGHLLHRACLIMYMKNNTKSGLMCPTCKKMHGVRTGDMPNGSMTYTTHSYSVPGHEGYGTIEITYNFSPGVYNGKRYVATGFPRICYLPDSPKGRKVLKLLKLAWDRRLTFTIGTSVTTGATDTVVWNEIHHKTEAHGNHSGHGYPDDNYLDNVLAELAAQGVEEGQNSDSNDLSNSSSDDDL